MGDSREQLKRRMRIRLQRIIDEFQQLVVDALAWNDVHPGCPPLDMEGDRVVVTCARHALAALESGESDELNYWSDRLASAAAAAELGAA